MAMKKTMIALMAGCLVAVLGACESQNVEQKAQKLENNELAGTWVLKSILLGDMMDLPCGISNEGKFEPITLELTTTKDETGAVLLLNGRSSVNQYSGSYALESYDETTKTGKLKMSPIGSTKMGGSPELMQCESRYFLLLGQAVDYQLSTINGKQQLELGVLSTQKSVAPIGGKGNFLIFEKQSK